MERGQTERPLVLLDVDGVINDFEALLALRETDDVGATAGEYQVDVIESHGWVLAIPRHMGELLRALTATTEVWWCSTWRHRANDDIAAHLGIEPLPVVDDGSDAWTVGWKVEAVRGLVAGALAAGRTVVWIEDFAGEYPDLEGVVYIDTAEEGCLRWEDLDDLVAAPR